MRIAHLIIFFVVLTLGSLFLPASSEAHANHQASSSHSQPDKAHVHAAANAQIEQYISDATTKNDHVGGGIACEYGCCAGACFSCCMLVSIDASASMNVSRSSDGNGWLYYTPPEDSLRIPDTPPPRV